MKYTVEKSSLEGVIRVSASKSQTMRAILLASMASGVSYIRHPLPSPDTEAMLAACSAFGARITRREDGFVLAGTGGRLTAPSQVLDVGNSGQVLRFGAAMAARIPEYCVFTGDESIRSRRPMQPLLDALACLGAFAVSSRNNGLAPVIIKGPVRPGLARMDGRDSQPVSAMLMLAAFLPGSTRLEVDSPGELPWIDLTLSWLDRLDIPHSNEKHSAYAVTGRTRVNGFQYTAPGDWSSAAFPIAAALVTNSALTLENMDILDPQGDKAVLDLWEGLGARFSIDREAGTVRVHRHQGLQGGLLDVNAVIDALPVLAAVACFAQSPTVITGAAIARSKESDRIAAIAGELAKMGAKIEQREDGLTVHPSALRGGVVHSRGDHRIAMALAVAGLGCGQTVVEDASCVAKSFPGFAAAMRGLGAMIRECA
ncbi:MAG: 3-phosphoshikimate 1-carboxyvinyltransferase [Deltaproteobacteria bacterium]|nr:3-phosphoshikimate 1-carboxyvinyltransferase [Deltaproteobacteria bacterium]